MTDREKVTSTFEKIISVCKEDGCDFVDLTFEDAEKILALLKEQEERYVSMVVSWLREIAINNVDSNREMTFLDAVEDIRDRASYGLKQYFIDKQEGR